MIRRFVLVAIVACAGVSSSVQEAKAFDPFIGSTFMSGYNNGYSYRLPTPPYFSIFPPVYYGRRYERPYGDSPFASQSLLGGNPTYNIRPKQSPVQWSVPVESAQEFPTAVGKQVTIVNPYVRADKAVAGN
ncbi:MAG: hypothetical protein NTW52_07140 [Planctomycetota bacterium]|nr:hypothetical protein [Planctomycetota bacterium]